MTLAMNQTDKNGAIHYNPEKFGRLSKAVVVLRKVNINKLLKRETPTADTAWELIGKGQVQLHLKESDLPWYEQGLIVLDQPRDEKVARDIMKATLGFAVARSDTGEVLKAYGPNGLSEAIADAEGITLTIKPMITKVASDEEEDEAALVESFLAENKNALDEAPVADEK